MTRNGAKVVRWLLVMWALAGCASLGLRPERTASITTQAARPKVDVITGAVPIQTTPPLPPAPAPAAPSGPLTVGQAKPPEPAPVRPPAQPAPAIPTGPAQIIFNFDNVDVEVLLQAAAEIVRFNYVLAPGVRGRKVTVNTLGKISREEVFPVLLTILNVNGLAAVRSGNLYRIIPREGAPQTSVKTIVGREVAATLPADEVFTQIVPLQFISASDAVNLLRPFVPQQGSIAAHRETNLLIITDTAANIRRLLGILELLDVEVTLSELQIIPLKYADAQDLAQLLSQLFVSGRLGGGLTGAGSSAPAPSQQPVPGAPSPGFPRPLSPGGEPQPSREPPLIVPERRSNSLVVHARKQEIETIRRLIEKLDVDIYGGQQVFIHFAENTRASDLATTLDAIYGRGDRGVAITGTQQSSRASSISGSYTAPSLSSSGFGLSPPGTGFRPITGTQRSFQAPSASGGTTSPPAPFAAPSRGFGPRQRGTGFPGISSEGAPDGVEIRFVADEVTNAIIVTTYPRLWTEIEQTIKKLDKMPRQVLIEVLAVEVRLTDDTKLGIEWAIRSGNFDVSSSPSNVLPGRPARGIIPLGGAVPAGLSLFVFAADKFLAALNALASENRVNVLSSPSIMTAENKQAVINVSTSVPIVTSQQVPVATGGITGNSITQAVEYRDAGIILTVTPRIGEQGTVALDVKQEVNEVGENEPPPINSPRFTKREAETSVVLLNNQTLVLGGLIQNKRTVVRSGIPWLSRIPILGYLFGSVENKIEKTELLLLLTPRVVGTPLDAARVTDQMRRGTPELEQSIRQAPRQPPPTKSE